MVHVVSKHVLNVDAETAVVGKINHFNILAAEVLQRTFYYSRFQPLGDHWPDLVSCVHGDHNL